MTPNPTHRPLGRTGLAVPQIAFGGWAIAGHSLADSPDAPDEATALATLNRAYELGCTFFHTADVFGGGRGETLLGQALRGWQRDRVMVATQGGWEMPAEKPNVSERHLTAALEASLSRLGVEAIDLYLLHTAPLAVIQHGQVFEVLRGFQRQGKIRFYGVAIHDPQEGIQAIAQGGVHAVQAAYNLFDRRPEPALLDRCRETGTAFIAREPLASGFLTGAFSPETVFPAGDHRARWPRLFLAKRAEAAKALLAAVPPHYPNLAALALNYVLARPEVSTAIVGCSTPAQIAANLAAADLPPLTEAELARVHAVLASIF